MNLLEKLKRWWAPGEYDDERGPSEGEGYAVSREDYELEREQQTQADMTRHGPHT
jgi:hypothetical protein